MKIALRRLTAREHVLAASVLVFALTMIAADITLPDAARLRSAGHPTTASILSVLPVFALAAALLVKGSRKASNKIDGLVSWEPGQRR